MQNKGGAMNILCVYAAIKFENININITTIDTYFFFNLNKNEIILNNTMDLYYKFLMIELTAYSKVYSSKRKVER
jgi:hypothetical protein